MIVGVISGYYRSGAGIFQKLYAQSNVNHIVLTDPTHHDIVDQIMQNGCLVESWIHGWHAYTDYFRLPRKIRHEFIRRHFEVFDRDKSQWGLMTSFGAVSYLLSPLDEFGMGIVIKSSQLHLQLLNMVKAYDCWVVHLDRDTANIIADHFTFNDLLLSDKARKFLHSRDGSLPFHGDLIFKSIVKHLGLDSSKVETNLDILVFNIEILRRIVYEQAEQSDRIYIVDFDEFVIDPVKVLKDLPFDMSQDALMELDPRKRNPVPKWLEHEVIESKEKLGFEG